VRRISISDCMRIREKRKTDCDEIGKNDMLKRKLSLTDTKIE